MLYFCNSLFCQKRFIENRLQLISFFSCKHTNLPFLAGIFTDTLHTSLLEYWNRDFKIENKRWDLCLLSLFLSLKIRETGNGYWRNNWNKEWSSWILLIMIIFRNKQIPQSQSDDLTTLSIKRNENLSNSWIYQPVRPQTIIERL